MFLGLDLGTTNVKSLVVDHTGTVLGEGSAPVERFATADGGVEQDLEQIWDATCRAASEAVKPHAAAIQAVGVSSQGGALQLLDGHERPLGRVISWMDSRGKPFDDELVRQVGLDWLVEHIGCNLSSMTLGQVLRLRQEDRDFREKMGTGTSPDAATVQETATSSEPVPIFSLARYVAFVGDCIVGRLCGRRAHDATSLSIGMLYNPSLRRADPDLLNRLGLREDQLPELLCATCPAGPLLPEAAARMGLPPGIPVSAAVHDQYAASVGAGCVHAGDVALGTGTAWVLLATTSRLAPPVTPRNFVGPHPVEGLFGQLLSMVNGGSSIEWALRLIGRASSSCAEIDDLLSAVPPGSEGLRFWPLLVSDSKGKVGMRPGGRMTGILLAHSAAHMVRAVIEGLACELGRHLRFFDAAGLPVRRLVMCGPAATSRVTPGIVAAVTDRPVTCIQEPATSAFGAAVIARAMVEPGGSLAALAEQMAPASRPIEPGQHRALYRAVLEEYLGTLNLNSTPSEI